MTMGKEITLKAADGHSFAAYEKTPSSGIVRGGLVVVQEIFGVNAHIRRVADGFAEDGYRVVMNCNGDAGQTVFQIHLHLLAGAPLGRFGTPGFSVRR